jgi:cation diffusion facilitator family transporter
MQFNYTITSTDSTHPSPNLTNTASSLRLCSHKVKFMQTDNRYSQTKKVSLISAVTNASLAVLKTIIGFLAHSQAMIADGLHSFSDLLADGLVLITARWSNKAPDYDHPYGHKRLETLSSIIIAFMLLAIGVGIIVHNIQDILHKTYAFKANYWVILTALASIISNELLFRYSRRIGIKINSDLLIANAWHNRSDALSSAIVLLSSVGEYLHIPYLDLLGAIIIAGLIIKMAIGMIFKSTNELIDAAVDPETLQQIKHLIEQTEGVQSAHQIRTRLHSGSILIDAHIIVNKKITVSEGHFIGEQVKYNLVHNNKKITDITLHIDSENDEHEHIGQHLPSRPELIAHINGYAKHCTAINQVIEYQIHYFEKGIDCTLVLPLSALKGITAEKLTQQYEQNLKKLDIIVSIRLLFSNEA